MELTREDILKKMAQFVESARQIKALKDFLLTFNFVSSDEEYLLGELKRHDEAVAEIGRIYDEEMIPIINELKEYLTENKELFDNIVKHEGLETLLCEDCGFEGYPEEFASKDQDDCLVCPKCGSGGGSCQEAYSDSP